jgi:peptide/nickel transport system substrate-binding protein
LIHSLEPLLCGLRPGWTPWLILVLLALGCGERSGPEWPEGQELTVAITNSPTNLDPRMGTDQASGKVCQLVLNGLVTKDPQGNLIPDLAESWEVLDGGARYRFHLRPGVLFHDGSTLDAADVVWTFGTILDGTVQTAKRAAYALVREVVAIDELTVDMVLEEPYGALLVDLTPAQGVIPNGMTPEEMNRQPIGTGPFRLVERTPEKVVLEPFAEHFRGAPHLQRLVLKEVPDSTVRALELLNGSVQLVVNDLAPDVVPTFRDDPAYQVISSPGANYAYLGLNLEDPALSDLRVRRALAMSIDRQRLVDTLWNRLGLVTETMLPPGLWARNEELEPIPYDPEAAARLLEEAGYPDPDGDGPEPRLRLEYKTSTNEPYVLQAQVIQNMARDAGIEIEVRSFEFATFYRDVQRGTFQIFSLVRTGVIDPNIYRLVLHSEAVPPQGQNRGFYRNPHFDQLIDEGARRALPEERRPFYLEAQQIVADELPYISLYTKINFAVMPAELEGYVNYPSGELFSLREVRWKR